MKFCYYCGKELGDTNAFCGGCGKRVVSGDHEESKARPVKKCKPVDGDDRVSSKKKRQKSKADEESNGQKETLVKTLYVSGDVHSTIFNFHRRLAFKTKEGNVVYTASGEVDVESGGFWFSTGSNKSTYEVCDSCGSVVGEVEFSHECDEGSPDYTSFTMRMPPAPPKPPAKNVFQKIAQALETDESDCEGWILSDSYPSLGELLSNRHVRTAGPYSVESEGKPLSLVPRRSEVFFGEGFCPREHVASIEPDGKSYRIELKAPGHSLASVLIYLALYARI